VVPNGRRPPSKFRRSRSWFRQQKRGAERAALGAPPRVPWLPWSLQEPDRLETITDLGVRMRETVRLLSDRWEA